MGRDWYWVGGSKSSSNSKRVEREPTTTTKVAGGDNGGGVGCISAVFNFFDFHHFQFSINHHHHHHHQQPPSFNSNSFLHENPIKGLEAPRNSMESLSEEASRLSSTNKTTKESLDIIPMGIQIKTRSSISDSSTETSYSPGAKTPNLVARLMGLDLLPDNINSSPSSSSSTTTTTLTTPKSNHHVQTKHSRRLPRPHGQQTVHHRHSVDGDMMITGTRSLPDTPRMSSARRSDVDQHHRLSLQLEFEDEKKSSREYARQIVKQVKESGSRKFGLDITNQIRQDHNLNLNLNLNLNCNKNYFKPCPNESTHGRPTTTSSSSSSSPRIRFIDPKQKPVNTNQSFPQQSSKKEQIPLKSPSTENCSDPKKLLKASAKPKLHPVLEDHHQQEQQQLIYRRPIKKFKKPETSQTSSTIIRQKQEEQHHWVRQYDRANIIVSSDYKKCKKPILSNEFINIPSVSSSSSLVQVKKNHSPPLATRLIIEKEDAQKSKKRLSCRPSHTYKQEAADTHISQNNRYATTATTFTGTTSYGAEYEYISRILRSTGINNLTPVYFASWFSSSHPLDPSVFYCLEQYFPVPSSKNGSSGQLGIRSNRKLLFQLVDELLVEFLNPHFSIKPWVNSKSNSKSISSSSSSSYSLNRRDCNESELITWLCSKIRNYPSSDCRILDDIDALIDKDLQDEKLQVKTVAFEEEAEGIATELENDILETLLNETAVDCFESKTHRLKLRCNRKCHVGISRD